MSADQTENALPHGLHYVSRDGAQQWHLDRFLAGRPAPRELPRPERDVLESLLTFCLEGLAHLRARESSLLPEPRSAP